MDDDEHNDDDDYVGGQASGSGKRAMGNDLFALLCHRQAQKNDHVSFCHTQTYNVK